MINLSPKRKLQALILVLAIPVIVYAKAEGPDPGYTGAPGDIGNCTNCHDDHLVNSGPGSLTLNGVPATYQPGQQYTLTITVQQANRSKYGFQLTAVDTHGNRAGTLASTGADTQVLSETGFGERQYIEHTLPGTFPTTQNSRSWQIHWTAPSTDIGSVVFYVAGNAADGDTTNQHDYIYTTNKTTDSPTSMVTVSLATQLDGQTLIADSVQRIDWNLTGQSNINLIEVRYSTDDGATFPIQNLVFSTTTASTTGFDWTVPNTSATMAKLRVQISTNTGSAVQTVSGRFTIQGDGAPVSKPVVTGVTVSGKKLTVMGNNFQDGAIILVNGAEQNTTNGDPPSQILKSKKGGKKIKPGVTVDITVKNPDGQTSDSFLFTRTDS